MIIIFDNVISEFQANYCIELVKSSKPTQEFAGRYCYNNESLFFQYLPFREIMDCIINKARDIIPDIQVDWSEINYWPKGSNHNSHFDESSPNTVMTSVTYLNLDYRGGETFFDDGTLLSPLVGRTVFFDGKKYKHGVRTISHGERFSLPIWYKFNK